MVKETYDFKDVLGEGASGAVIKVVHKTTKEHFACKIIRKGKLNDIRLVLLLIDCICCYNAIGLILVNGQIQIFISWIDLCDI